MIEEATRWAAVPGPLPAPEAVRDVADLINALGAAEDRLPGLDWEDEGAAVGAHLLRVEIPTVWWDPATGRQDGLAVTTVAFRAPTDTLAVAWSSDDSPPGPAWTTPRAVWADLRDLIGDALTAGLDDPTP